MPIETLDDIVEDLADKLYIYGAERRNEWIEGLKDRIRAACEVERRLSLVVKPWQLEVERYYLSEAEEEE